MEVVLRAALLSGQLTTSFCAIMVKGKRSADGRAYNRRMKTSRSNESGALHHGRVSRNNRQDASDKQIHVYVRYLRQSRRPENVGTSKGLEVLRQSVSVERSHRGMTRSSEAVLSTTVMLTSASLCFIRHFPEHMLFGDSRIQKSILPEMSNSRSPPAKPGVYLNEIEIVEIVRCLTTAGFPHAVVAKTATWF
jgi:hypothetical protein